MQLDLRQTTKGVQATDAWIQVDEEEHGARGKTTIPLRRIAFGPIKLDSWVEETQSKLKLPDRSTMSNSDTMDLTF